ncbi:MAG: serine/threonine protein kinase [Deltaproteobacteria bacterium]|nr:serine/threonine protein kinase [Deltaproteobacteria bacterium]
MAEVFLAQRLGEGGFARTVAIKTILAHGAEEEAVRLFLDEARVAASLEHVAIVQTIDLGYENETLFIVMEYVPGPTLSRLVRELKKRGTSLNPEVVAHIGARVASALDYAHRRATSPDGTPLELVHRDISPQNILLTRTGLVKLSDFGVARASIQTHKTKTGQVRGKAAYMSPEQVRAKPLDGRTDVFALGLVLFEALTGKRAFHRSGDIQSMRAVLSDPVPPVRQLNPSVSEDLEAVLMRAVEKDPLRRFQTAGEMEQALATACAHVSTSRLEQQITRAIDDVFGTEEMYSSSADGPAVEAWQPTIAHSAIDAGPQRIGGRLDPEIARMLATPTSSHGPASTGDLVTPSGERAGPPLPYVGGAPGFTAPSMESRPFLDYSSGSMTHAGATLTGTTQPKALFPRRRLVRFGLPLLAAMLGVVGMMAWRLVSSPTPAPEPNAPPLGAPATPAAVMAQPAAHVPEIEAAPAAPAAEPASPTAKATPPPVRPRPTAAPAPAPSREPPPTEQAARPLKPPKPAASDPASIKKRLLAAANAHAERGNAELAGQLKSVLLSLSMGAAPKPQDEALLNKAEAELRR